MTQLQAVLRTHPEAGSAHHSLGNVLLRLGRNEDAVREFEAGQQLQPEPDTAKKLEELRPQKKK